MTVATCVDTLQLCRVWHIGDFRLFPTMSPIVTLDGIITIEDVMEHLIGEEIDDETDGHKASLVRYQLPPGPTTQCD